MYNIKKTEKNSLENVKKQKILKISNKNQETEPNEVINVSGIIKETKMCFGLKYEKFGNVRCFYIQKQISPIIVIGPHWYLFILMNIITIPSFIFFL